MHVSTKISSVIKFIYSGQQGLSFNCHKSNIVQAPSDLYYKPMTIVNDNSEL